MHHPRTHRTARSAFTLIELLVVIAIIAVLVSLLSSAVMRVRLVAVRTQTTNDITKLQDGLSAAMKRYNDASVLPSRLVLFNQLNRYTTNPPSGETAFDTALRGRSRNALRKMFGQRFFTSATYVSWDGAASPTDSKNVLEGGQCLVFYLGGLTTTNGSTRGCFGFSTNPTNPMAAPVPGQDRIGPFFDFKSSRLVGGPFFFYLDPYHSAGDPLAKPFAYFSSTEAPNSYNPYFAFSTPAAAQVSDCPSLTVWPYVDATGKYLNPNTCQIISAGADGNFSIGGGPPSAGGVPPFSSSVYSPQTGATDSATGDNQANFSKSLLSGPQSN